MDKIVRGIAGEGQIRCFAMESTQLVEEARQHHNTSPVATAALGRLLTGGAMMGVMMKGENDIYSTLDLCMVNLYSGMARLYKVGAAAAFIRREDEVECIASENLPVGARAHLDAKPREIQLNDGDFIVMVTDGVLEYLHVPKPEETMREMILSIKTNNPGILAKKIMDRVMLFTGGRAQDDMTVLAACIWKKA